MVKIRDEFLRIYFNNKTGCCKNIRLWLKNFMSKVTHKQ